MIEHNHLNVRALCNWPFEVIDTGTIREDRLTKVALPSLADCLTQMRLLAARNLCQNLVPILRQIIGVNEPPCDGS